MGLRKKIFLKITVYLITLFIVTILCVITYLNLDYRYNLIKKEKLLTEFVAKQSEEIYVSNDQAKLQTLLNQIVNNHKEIYGIYIKKENNIIFKSLINSELNNFYKIKNALLKNKSLEEDVFEFQNVDGKDFFDISSKIGNDKSTIHVLLVSKSIIDNQISSKDLIAFSIGFIGLLLGVFIIDRFSVSLIKEINNKNNKLIESEKLWRLLFNSSPLGIVTINQEGVIVQCNDSIKQIFNLTPTQIIGKHITETIELNTDNGDKEYCSNINNLPFIENEITTIGTDDGIIHELKRTPIPLFYSDNSLKGAMICYLDITERNRKEKELNLYSTRLEELASIKTLELQSANKLLSQEIKDRKLIENNLKQVNADKDKLFSIVAHDLRSPFNSLLGSSEFLSNEIDTLTNDEIKELVNNLNHSTKNVFKLLKNLLTWARLHTGQIQFSPEPLNLKELVNEVCELYNVSAVNKGIKLSNNIKKDIIVFADSNMLNIVLRNHVSNAIKFTNKGDKIDVNCLLQNKLVNISVKDTGIGMSKDTIDKLFNIGYNSSTIGTQGEKGTGLGLILTKDFIERNNGKFAIESSLGVGSTFSVTLPLYNEN